MIAARFLFAVVVYFGALRGLGWAGDAPATAPAESPRLDPLGDPLPKGALVRFGTTRLRHDANALVFRDGKTIVSLGSSIRFWDATTGQLIKEIRNQKLADSEEATISADAKHAVTRHNENDFRVWELDSGRLIREFKTNNENFSMPDDQRRLSSSTDGSRFIVRKTDFNRQAGTLEQRPVIYSTVPGKSPIKLQTGNNHLRACCMSPNAEQAVTLEDAQAGAPNEKQLLNFWDAATGKRIRSDELKAETFDQIDFAPGGKALICIGEKKLALRTIDGKELWRASGEFEGVQIACSTGNRLVVLAPKEEAGKVEAHVVDLSSGKVLKKWLVPGGLATAAAISPDGERLAIAGGARFRILNVLDGKDLVAAPGHSGGIWTTSVTPDGRFVVSSDSTDNEPILWEIATGRIVRSFTGNTDACVCAACSHDGKLVASCTSGGTARIWELATGKQLFHLEQQQEQIWCIGFLADDQYLALISAGGGGISVYDYRKSKTISEMKVDLGGYPCVTYCQSDGRFFAVYPNGGPNFGPNSQVNGFDLWDVRAGRVFRHFDGQHGAWFRCAVTHDLRTLATLNDDGKIRLWEVATGKLRMGIKAGASQHDGSGWTPLEISPDGLTIACTGNAESRIDFWDVPSGTRFGNLKAHDEQIMTIDFTPDGRTLLTGSKDTTMLTWDLTRPEWRSRSFAHELTDTDLPKHWEKLRGADAEEAHRSKWALAGDPKKSIPFIRDRLRMEPPIAAERIRSWIADLDSRQYAIREQAQANLLIHFDQAERDLRQTLGGSASAELRNRIGRIIGASFGAQPGPDQLREMRAMEILEQIGTPEARDLLRRLAAAEPSTRLSRDAAESLKRLEEKPR